MYIAIAYEPDEDGYAVRTVFSDNKGDGYVNRISSKEIILRWFLKDMVFIDLANSADDCT